MKFLLVWAAILGVFVTACLQPAVFFATFLVLLVLCITAGLAWNLTHLEDE